MPCQKKEKVSFVKSSDCVETEPTHMGEETRQKDVKSTFKYILHIFHTEVLLNIA